MDPIISLAFSMYSNPGVYAVLLGSGVSRSAQIPTGWQIVLDLCEKLASAYEEDTLGAPELWYREKFGKEARYDDLLDSVCSTADERQALLKGYFEQSEDDHESEHKLPTHAHKAIAWLVKEGFIRVILTTNFDPLMEMALQEQGIPFDVVSTEDAIKGIRPIIHSNCTIIKLHGDYRDTRIKNTPEELSNYPEEINKILERILDEFGLIIAGWSGEWDEALKNAMYRAINRRYSWYWLEVGGISEAAKSMIQHRQAKIVKMTGADEFFTTLKNQVEGISTSKKKHPLTYDLALTIAKKLVSRKQDIELQDLINEESFSIRNEILGMELSGAEEQFLIQLDQYPQLTSRFIGLVIPLVAFGNEPLHHEIYKNSISRIGALPVVGSSTWLIELRSYPALLVMYIAGITAVAYKRYDWLKTILLHKGRYDLNKYSLVPFINKHQIYSVFGSAERIIPNTSSSNFTPANQHVFNLLKPFMMSILPTEEEYTDAFDLFEWLNCLIYIGKNELVTWPPVGCFTWRRSFKPLLEDFLREGAILNEQWPLITECFEGEVDSFKNSLNTLFKILPTTRILGVDKWDI
jgi:hypothetical protein